MPFSLVNTTLAINGIKCRWLDGRVAIYGLGILDVWATGIDNFIDPSNTDRLIAVDESITDKLKTCERVVFPQNIVKT